MSGLAPEKMETQNREKDRSKRQLLLALWRPLLQTLARSGRDRAHLQILRKFEVEFGFCRQLFLASCVHLGARASGAAYKGTDRRTLSAAQQGTQHGSYGGATAYVFAGSLVHTQPSGS
jgi:hypothetical protein